MLSTVRIVSGAKGISWNREQRNCIIEIRSEHALNDPTSFSILMNDVPGREESGRHLAAGEVVAVLVRPEDKGAWHVLFQGKVSEIDEHHTQGGVGSTILYRGKDIRTIMAARSHTGAWSGQVDAVMTHLIAQDFPDPVVEAPEQNALDEHENPLGQNSNNLDFLRNQAVAYGHNFWVSYATVPEASGGLGSLDPLGDSAPSVAITPCIHWERSPYFSAGGAASAAGGVALPGIGTGNAGPIVFKVHIDSERCPNVTAFQVISEGEKVQTMTPGAAELPAAPTNPLAPPADADIPNVHFVPPAVQQGGERPPVNAVLEQERGFDRKVRLSTTKAMLKRLCFPNDLATLEGVAATFSKKLFRVSGVTHVIRLDGHWMDAQLESDGQAYSGSTAGGRAEALGALA